MAVPLAELAERVLAKLSALGLTLATAESCTAGRLATLLADAPGAADRFHGGFVTYTKHNKSAVLGVPAELIAAHTAVSRPVAEAMATGALERCPADMVLAITGVAGPEPDEDGNPVGLMHVAAVWRGRGAHHRSHAFGEGNREALRERAMAAVLNLAIQVLSEMQPANSTRP
jgi:nicotinamide-nucleotide amidase